MKVLAISGSLRAASVNSALLRAAARLAPPGIEIALYGGTGALPLFNPDLEAQAPAQVGALRAAVAAADALIIASPEYAHGVTGVIKNTLDWLVSFEPAAYKKAAVFSASPRSEYADPALKETLRTMSAIIVERACFSAQLVGAKLGEEDMVQAPEIAGAIRAALAALRDHSPGTAMDDQLAPYHAHIYYTLATRAQAVALEQRLQQAKASGEIAGLLFIGVLRDRALGPHPIPEYEIHFTEAMVPAIVALIEASGLTALVHPLTDDDVADHTTLAHWIGAPLPLKLETLDPPGVNQGVPRFGKSDF